MIGILIIAHGNLGDSLIQCMTHLLGNKPDGITCLQVSGTDDARSLLPTAQRLVAAVDDGDGVLVITDIFGSTPSNLACKLLVPGHVEGVAGEDRLYLQLHRAGGVRRAELEVLLLELVRERELLRRAVGELRNDEFWPVVPTPILLRVPDPRPERHPGQGAVPAEVRQHPGTEAASRISLHPRRGLLGVSDVRNVVAGTI